MGRLPSSVSRLVASCCNMGMRSSRHVFVVDCGSRHTEIHHLVVEADGSIEETASDRVRPEGKEAGNVPLGSVLEAGTYKSEFFPVLLRGLFSLGWRDERRMSVFIGATGGVRKLRERGQLSDQQVADFEAALNEALPHARCHLAFHILTGDDEARYELTATQHIFAPFFAAEGKGRVQFFSGGGATCQFGHGEPAELCSLNAHTKFAQDVLKANMKAPLEEKRAVLAKVRQDYEKIVDEWWPASPLPQLLEGSYVGIEMHEDCAQLGFNNVFITPPQAVARIDQICEDLLAQQGDGWAKAMAKWKEWAGENWVIGVAAALRLRAILRHFDDRSSLYFAKSAPGAQCKVSWPIGYVAAGAEAAVPARPERKPLESLDA